MLPKEQVIAQVFYDRAKGFGSIADTYREARGLDPRITLADVRAFLAKQEIRQRHKPAKYNSFVADLPREEIQVDLADFGERATPRYCFVAIDIFTKEAAAFPLANKTPALTAEALEKTFSDLGYPVSVFCDEGGEFHGAFADTARKEGVSLVYSRTGGRFVERFIRTLKLDLFERVRSLGGRWASYLEDVVNRYNHHRSAAHNARPATVADHEYEFGFMENIWARLKHRAKFPVKHTRIEAGDHVKIRIKPPSAGYKETRSSWSETVYTVDRVDRGVDGGDRYYLRDYRRPLLRFELLRVEDVQRPIGGEVRSILQRVQHPRVPPPVAARNLRARGQPPVFRPATRASAPPARPAEAASGSGLTDAQRAAVPTLASSAAPPAAAPPPALMMPPAAPAPKAVARRPPPPVLAHSTRSTQRH